MPRGVPRLGQPPQPESPEGASPSNTVTIEAPERQLTAAEIDAQIQAASEAHEQAVLDAEAQHQQKLLTLLDQRRAAEEREAARVDEAVAERMARLQQAMSASEATDEAEPEEDTATKDFLAVIHAYVDPVLAKVDATSK
jgi:hypothetical protein